MPKTAKRQTHQYDKIIKENFDAVIPALIAKLLHIEVVNEEDIPNSLQYTKEREADFLKIITDAQGERYILHLEFQVADDAKMLYRMLEYSAMLRRQYQLSVVQYVIFLSSHFPTMRNELQDKDLYFRYNLISLIGIDYQHFMQSNQPEEIIFSILANFGNQPADLIVEQIITKLKYQSQSILHLEKCVQQLRVLSNLRNFEPLINKIMESITLYIKEENDILYIKGKNDGEARGEVRGQALKNHTFTLNLIQFTDFDDAKIALLVGVTEEYVHSVRMEIQSS